MKPETEERIMASDLTMAQLIDRADITDLINRYATGIDRRDWPLYRSIFLPEVHADFSSWSGEPRSKLDADAWTAGVAKVLSGFDATQHVLTNFVITLHGDEATAVVYMSAHHHLVEDGVRKMHSIGGYYTHHLVRTSEGWRIADFTLTVTWEMGDRILFDRAAERMAA
jgi:hypothetical protein